MSTSTLSLGATIGYGWCHAGGWAPVDGVIVSRAVALFFLARCPVRMMIQQTKDETVCVRCLLLFPPKKRKSNLSGRGGNAEWQQINGQLCHRFMKCVVSLQRAQSRQPPPQLRGPSAVCLTVLSGLSCGLRRLEQARGRAASIIG